MSRLVFLSSMAFFLVAMSVDQGNCEKQTSFLDAAGNIEMTWETDPLQQENITFEITAKTLGFIGFGIAPKSSMIGADMIIGGVKDGVPYFQDRFSNDTVEPTIDAHQNWKLLDAKENGTHTYLKFWRPLDTCDDQDLVISSDTVTLIWSYGLTDDIQYHAERGGKQFNLFDPPAPDFDASKLVKWEVRVNDPLEAEETIYKCTVHKLSKFETVHQMIAVEAYLEDEMSVKHTHHFTATVCNQEEPGMVEKLRELHGKPGLPCYTGIYKELKPKCNNILFGWAVGGKRIVLPDDVGVPIGGDDQDEDQYVMFEVHYDNPKKAAGLQFTSGFNLYFTNETREKEGSVIMIGTEILPSLFIPPNTDEFTLSGHCSSEYTREFLPKDGITVVDAFMHSHLSGRKLRVRHFRDGVELPWIMKDDHYDFDYQQTRQLREQIKIMPGDHVTMECVMSTTGKPVVTMAGEATQDEMCHVFLFYYPRVDLLACRSYYPLPKLFNKFGVLAVNATSDNPLDPVVTLPKKFQNMTFSEVANKKEYTPRFVKNLQSELRYGDHVSTFVFATVSTESKARLGAVYNKTRYPEITKDFALPLSTCRANGNGYGGGSSSVLASAVIVIFAALFSLSAVSKIL